MSNPEIEYRELPNGHAARVLIGKKFQIKGQYEEKGGPNKFTLFMAVAELQFNIAMVRELASNKEFWNV